MIPAAQENAVAAALFASKYYPTPINGNPTNNAINQTGSAFNADQGDAKVDWNITEKDRLSARYTQAYQNDPSTNSLLILANSSTHVPLSQCGRNLDPHLKPQHIERSSCGRFLDHDHDGYRLHPQHR